MRTESGFLSLSGVSEFSPAELRELCLVQALLLAKRIEIGAPTDPRSFKNLARVHTDLARAGIAKCRRT